MSSTITYLVPIFNEESNIESTVIKISNSFQDNFLQSYEIVFIDDGSTDDSVQDNKKYD